MHLLNHAFHYLIVFAHVYWLFYVLHVNSYDRYIGKCYLSEIKEGKPSSEVVEVAENL